MECHYCKEPADHTIQSRQKTGYLKTPVDEAGRCFTCKNAICRAHFDRYVETYPPQRGYRAWDVAYLARCHECRKALVKEAEWYRDWLGIFGWPCTVIHRWCLGVE